MTAEQIFSICNSLALLGWLILIFAGKHVAQVSRLVVGVVVPLILAVVYAALIAAHWGESSGNFQSLAGVAALFSNPWLLLAGWVHYLAFDLFIGCWEVRDAQAHHIPHLLVVPCLLLTFLFGPIGLLLYFVIRAARTKTVQIEA